MTAKFFTALLGPNNGVSGVVSTGYDTIEQARREGIARMGANLRAEKVGIFQLVETGERQASPIDYTPTIDTTSIKTDIDAIDQATRSHDQDPFKRTSINGPIDPNNQF